MKILIKIFFIFILSFSFFNNSFSWTFSEMSGGEPEVHIDCGEEDCNLESGVRLVKETVVGIETERKFSVYIQDIIVYLLSFISVIAIIYIIYAGFRILTGVGDEEVLKKQKKTIMYVVIGMLVIWLAYPIVKFIIDVLNKS